MGVELIDGGVNKITRVFEGSDASKDHERHLGFDTPHSDLGIGPSLNSHQELPLNLTTFIGICFTLTACFEIKYQGL